MEQHPREQPRLYPLALEEESSDSDEEEYDTPLKNKDHLLFNQSHLISEQLESGLDDSFTDMIMNSYAKYFERTYCTYQENRCYSHTYIMLKLQQAIQFETNRAKGDEVVGKLRGIFLFSFMFDNILHQLKKDVLRHRIPGNIVKSEKEYEDFMNTYHLPFCQFDKNKKDGLVKYLDEALKQDIESCIDNHLELPKVLGHVCFVYKLRHRLETYIRRSGLAPIDEPERV